MKPQYPILQEHGIAKATESGEWALSLFNDSRRKVYGSQCRDNTDSFYTNLTCRLIAAILAI
jgi:hypothetical protein